MEGHAVHSLQTLLDRELVLANFKYKKHNNVYIMGVIFVV